MKIMTLLGTRPELIRTSLISRVLDQHSEHVIIHTLEQGEDALNADVLSALDLRAPDVQIRGTGEDATAEEIALSIDPFIREFAPDRLLVVDGSATARAASIASAYRPVYVLGGTSGEQYGQNATLLTYAAQPASSYQRSIAVGCPQLEVLDSFDDRIEASGVVAAVGVRAFDYFLAIVGSGPSQAPSQIEKILDAISTVAETFGRLVLVVTHPRFARTVAASHLTPTSKGVRLLRPLNFFDLVNLQKNTLCVITDSVGVQEEAAILRVPCVTLGIDTPRIETVSCGANIIAGLEAEGVRRCVELSIAQPAGWDPPAEYSRSNVSQIVSKIVLAAK